MITAQLVITNFIWILLTLHATSVMQSMILCVLPVTIYSALNVCGRMT